MISQNLKKNTGLLRELCMNFDRLSNVKDLPHKVKSFLKNLVPDLVYKTDIFEVIKRQQLKIKRRQLKVVDAIIERLKKRRIKGEQDIIRREQDIIKKEQDIAKKAELNTQHKNELENKLQLKLQRIHETAEYRANRLKQPKQPNKLKSSDKNDLKLQKAEEAERKFKYKAILKLQRKTEVEDRIEEKALQKLEHEALHYGEAEGMLLCIIQDRERKKEERERKRLNKAKEKIKLKLKTKTQRKVRKKANVKTKKIREKKLKPIIVKTPTTIIKTIIIDLTSKTFALQDIDLIESITTDYLKEIVNNNKDLIYIIRFKFVIELKNIKYIAIKEKTNLEDFISKLASLRHHASKMLHAYNEFIKIKDLIKQLQFKCTNMLRIYNYSDILFSDLNLIRENVLKTVMNVYKQICPDYLIKFSLSIKRINFVKFTSNDTFIFTNFNDFQEKVLLAKKQVLTLKSSKYKKPTINDEKTNYNV